MVLGSTGPTINEILSKSDHNVFTGAYNHTVMSVTNISGLVWRACGFIFRYLELWLPHVTFAVHPGLKLHLSDAHCRAYTGMLAVGAPNFKQYFPQNIYTVLLWVCYRSLLFHCNLYISRFWWMPHWHYHHRMSALVPIGWYRTI